MDKLVLTDTREVSMRVLVDRDLFELEKERIFGRSWLFLGHESEIPNNGDYLLRRMASDQVLITRQADDSIAVMLNMCRHRGMELCRTEAGNATRFICPYHGWTFTHSGAFVSAPVPSQKMHGDILERSELGLIQARVELFCGMIFATWDQELCDLETYLGDIAPYFRIMLGKTSKGQTVLGPPQRMVIEANWKTAAEQFAGDDFHSFTLHQSLRELQAKDLPEDQRAKFESDRRSGLRNVHVDVSVPQGHAVMCFPKAGFDIATGRPQEGISAPERLAAVSPAGVPAHAVADVIDRFDADELDIMAFCPPQTGLIFPNFGMVQAPYPAGAFTCLHSFVPLGHDRFEFLTWILCERDADEEDRRKSARAAITNVGSSGIIEQDDTEVWPSIQRIASGYAGAKMGTLKYQAVLGESRPPEWPGGGTVYAGFSKDDNQWNFWKRWRALMA